MSKNPNDGIYQRSYIKPHQLEESSPRSSYKSMVNQEMDLEDLKSLKRENVKARMFTCLSDRLNVKV